MKTASQFVLVVLMLICGSMPVKAQAVRQVDGIGGEDPHYKSSWWDFTSPVALKKGTKIKLQIAGGASQVLVRILNVGEPSNQPVGVIGKYSLLSGNELEITLSRDFPKACQISIHYGHPWHYPLPSANGNPAFLESVEYVTADATSTE
jgi:hypothetical protein